MVSVVLFRDEVAVIVQVPYSNLITDFIWLYLLSAHTAGHTFTPSLRLAKQKTTPNGVAVRRQKRAGKRQKDAPVFGEASFCFDYLA